MFRRRLFCGGGAAEGRDSRPRGGEQPAEERSGADTRGGCSPPLMKSFSFSLKALAALSEGVTCRSRQGVKKLVFVCFIKPCVWTLEFIHSLGDHQSHALSESPSLSVHACSAQLCHTEGLRRGERPDPLRSRHAPVQMCRRAVGSQQQLRPRCVVGDVHDRPIRGFVRAREVEATVQAILTVGAAARKRRPLFHFSLSLSRACLCKRLRSSR
jgi:hypothetical protein